MEKKEYLNHYNAEEKHWWFKGQRKILLSVFNKVVNKNHNIKIVDAGCGTGKNIIELQKFGEVIGVDNSIDALRFCSNRGVKNLLNNDISKINLKDSTIDVIVCVGVFYHKDVDVEQTIKEFKRILKKKGKIIILTPANNIFRSWILRTYHDESMHTGRRHNINELSTIFQEYGLKVCMKNYYTFFLFPLVILYRVFIKMFNFLYEKNYSDIAIIKENLLTSILEKIMFLEALLINKIYFPFGVNLVIVAEK